MIPISLVTVNYNHSELTIALIDSLKTCERLDFELIIVDNGSEIPFQYSQELPFEYKIIHSKANLGFGGGNELGMKEANGEIIYLVNNDTEFSGDFVTPILTSFNEHSNLGMLSTLLRFFDTGLIQYAGATELSPITLRNRSFGNGELDATPYKGFRLTGYIHGASLAIRKSVYEQVGGMWEPYFLYYEEYDWCARVKAAGFDIGFLGDVEVLHKESASVGRMSPLKVRYMTRNRLIFARRNVGLYAPLTLAYLTLVVAVRDILKYGLAGDSHLIGPVLSGVKKGLTDSIR